MMMRFAALLFLPLLATGCFHKKAKGPPPKLSIVKRFYGQAQMRAAMGNANRQIDLSGLRFEAGSLPGTGRYPHENESSVVVASTDPELRDAVQIIVTPRIGSVEEESLPPDADFMVNPAMVAEAVQRSRYVHVELGVLPGGAQKQEGTGR
jgi:hypothetical protein